MNTPNLETGRVILGLTVIRRAGFPPHGVPSGSERRVSKSPDILRWSILIAAGYALRRGFPAG
jgi:hypothetical protein